jgi:hypothetical protein
MQVPNNAYNFVPGEQPDRYLQTICSYKAAILNLLQMLIVETSWPELKSESTVFKTVDKELRDTIYNLEILGEDPVDNRIDIEAVLNALNVAYIALVEASMFADETKVHVRIEGLHKIRECRGHLRVAVGLMNC